MIIRKSKKKRSKVMISESEKERSKVMASKSEKLCECKNEEICSQRREKKITKVKFNFENFYANEVISTDKDLRWYAKM